MAQFFGRRCVGVGSGITPDSKRQHTGMNLGSYQRYMRKFADFRAHGAPMGASRRELAQELLDTFRTFKAAADDCDDYVELPDYDATVQELEAIVSQESPGTHATAILRSCTHILVRFANQDQAASPVQNRPRRKSGCGWTQFQFRWEAMLAMVALEQAKGAGCGGGHNRLRVWPVGYRCIIMLPQTSQRLLPFSTATAANTKQPVLVLVNDYGYRYWWRRMPNTFECLLNVYWCVNSS